MVADVTQLAPVLDACSKARAQPKHVTQSIVACAKIHNMKRKIGYALTLASILHLTVCFVNGLSSSQVSTRVDARNRRKVNAPSPPTAEHRIPKQKLTPPFPDGPCGGTLVTLPPEDTYGIDAKLAGNTFLLPPRPIQVWVPPGGNKVRRPVLYCHDGQNAVTDDDSWTGHSWRLTGALTRLHQHGLIGTAAAPTDSPGSDVLPIVVLLPSTDENIFPAVKRRYVEYGDYNTPFASAHVDFCVHTLKPIVDAHFLTYTGKSDTAVMGSSLGGQAALHMALKHPNVFGGLACISPFFGPASLAALHQQARKLRDTRIYVDIGGDVEDTKVPWLDVLDHMTPNHWWNPGYFWLDTPLQVMVQEFRKALDNVNVEYDYHQAVGGRHNERAWSHRIDKPLLTLYGERQMKP